MGRRGLGECYGAKFAVAVQLLHGHQEKQKMRVLVTSSRGTVGSQIVSDLSNLDHTVVGYDLADGWDGLDAGTISRRMKGDS